MLEIHQTTTIPKEPQIILEEKKERRITFLPTTPQRRKRRKLDNKIHRR